MTSILCLLPSIKLFLPRNSYVRMNSGFENDFAATVGFFDGVHNGHRFLADRLKAEAAMRNLRPRMITFREHPRLILKDGFHPLLLTSPEQKLSLLGLLGVDSIIELHFTSQLAQMTAEEFMAGILRDKLGVKCLLMGHDHHFGHDGITDFETYRNIGSRVGIEVVTAEAFMWEGSPVSSSRIRRCLAAGETESAAAMLGRIYSISGTVVHGQQNGRKMGFPTANLDSEYQYLQVPKDGVYAAWACVRDELFMSMVNIGYRPTINGESRIRTIEAHLLDFDCDIYGEHLKLCFVRYIRPESRFKDISSLTCQLTLDRDNVRSVLSSFPPPLECMKKKGSTLMM